MSNLTIRAMRPEDRGFVYSTWLKGLIYGSPYYKNVNREAFFANVSMQIDHILDAVGTDVRVCCLEEDKDVVLGYVVYSSSQACHWVFVKHAWRRQGIGKKLLPEAIKAYTARTPAGDAIAAKRGWEFNPWAP